MVLKKRFSYQWRIFLPIFICIWLVILGMFTWHVKGVREIRDEMAYDQLDLAGHRIIDAYVNNDTAAIINFTTFANKFYDVSENYDPMCVWVFDTSNDSLVRNIGGIVSTDFDLPPGRRGTLDIPAKYLEGDSVSDTKFLYATYLTPQKDRLVYVMLPYTKRLQATLSSRTTYFWLMCVAVGIFTTLIIYISIAYFMRNLRMLRSFAIKANSDPRFIPPAEIDFPNNEIGDITKQVINIYKQRMLENEKREREHAVALNAVEDKNRLKRELTSNINHELKTPVGVMKSYLDTLVANPDMDAEMRDKFLAKAQDSANRLTSLIQDITSITRLESGGKLVNITEINFHDLVYAFDNYLEETGLLEGKMTFSYDIPLQCPILGNDTLLTTVLTNLVKNAVAYSEGTECHLILTKQDSEFYYFKFFDNGIGVPPEHLPYMFERFYRVNAGRSRNAGGTGLGLSIVEVTIQSLGGDINVLNHFPNGLEFNFTLPKYNKDDNVRQRKSRNYSENK